MEEIEELEATTKQMGNKKSQKIRLESLNPKGKRGRGMIMTLSMTAAVSTVQSVRSREEPSGLKTLKSVGPFLGTREIRGKRLKT